MLAGSLFILFGLCFFLDRRAKLVLSAMGVQYAGWGARAIPWENFAGFRLVRWRGQSLVQLVPRQSDLLTERLSAFGRLNMFAQRFWRQPQFGIPIFTFSGPVKEAVDRIRARLPELPDA